jgi:acetyl-CoA carboxylase biotin carboxylase subunit
VEEIGYPVLLKAAAGGGGRGIRTVRRPEELRGAVQTAAAEAEAAFGDGTLYVERYVAHARHVEVQVFGDREGGVIHVGDRDCSLQRRFQKVVEEAPATLVPRAVRQTILAAAVTLAEHIGYENAGTVEFIYDEDRREFHFLEMNTRIQVEHPVTEEITGIDLVQLQLRVAAGEPLGMTQSEVRLAGHAIECRITAEQPAAGFRPSPGLITRWEQPDGPGVRLDTHCYTGYRVPPFYDSLLGKLITSGSDRQEAVARMRDALDDFRVEGVDTTIAFLADLLSHPEYRDGCVDTRWVEEQTSFLRPV